MSNSHPLTVNKETVSNLTFPETDVLATKSEMKKRQMDLERATTLTNVEHDKIRIVFQDEDGMKQVESTIWATTNTRIILKGGMVIPINRIHQVKIM